MISHIELLQYTNNKSMVRYHATAVDKDGTRAELAIDSCVYERAKRQAQHVSDACRVKLLDKTTHSDLFNARTPEEAHALMEKY